MSDYLIVANGNFLVRDILLEAASTRLIVALDGAAYKLARLGIQPHTILGDFDSLSAQAKAYFGIQHGFTTMHDHDLPYVGHQGVRIVPAKNQAKTDLTKAIHYCDQQGATHITIVCATGGRLDHHEGVMRSLRVEYKRDRPILLHTEQQTLRFMRDETLTFSGNIGDKCGVVAYPQGWCTSSGLEYEAHQLPLEFGFSENTCNSLSATQASVTIGGEALLIMPAQLKSQRDYMGMSEKARLLLQLREMEND